GLLPARGAHRLHSRDHRRGAGCGRRERRAVPLRPAGVRGAARREARLRGLRDAGGGGDHLVDPEPGVPERVHGARARAAGGRAEAERVPQAGYELRPIAVQGLSRTNPLRAARAVLKAGAAVRAAGAILRDVRPDAVMGGGGYVAGPVGLAALLRRIPLVLTEADSHLGLANRLLAGRARRV